MVLEKLILRNFQGIKEMTVSPNGQNFEIRGRNGAGKTTVFNAITWLLFDKASTGEKGFSPKTRNKLGEEIHYLDNSVEGIFKLGDGRLISLKKTLSEIWSKKRGAEAPEFTGNTLSFAIDGVPCSKGEFDKRLEEIAPPDKAKLLTQPEYFAEEMKWQDRRSLLLDICGDVSEFDVINSDDELKRLTAFLLMPGTDGQFYTVEEFGKIAAAKSKEINEKLKELPSRIDEVNRSIKDIEDDGDAVLNSLNEAENRRDKLMLSLQNGLKSEASEKIKDRLRQIETEIFTARQKYEERERAASLEKKREINVIKDNISDITFERCDTERRLNGAMTDYGAVSEIRKRLAEKYSDLKGSEFNPDSAVCPTCGRAYDEEKISDIAAEFNLKKAQEMEKIRREIEETCSKDILGRINTDIEAYKGKLLKLDERLKELNGLLEEKSADISESIPFEETTDFKAFEEEKSELELMLNDEEALIKEAARDTDEELRAVKDEITELSDKLYTIRGNASLRARAEELEAEEKKLSSEWEHLQKGVYLCEKFIKVKVGLLTEKINKRFKNISFKLFETQINGGLKEICDVLVPCGGALVPYQSANHASRIIAGLEIIETLSEHFGLSMPVIIDNAESILSIPEAKTQVIKLTVADEEFSAKEV